MVFGAVFAAGPLAMGPGAAMLITVAVIFVALILLDRWQSARKARRNAELLAAGVETEAEQRAREKQEKSGGLWGALFGPPAGEDPVDDHLQDLHPDEYEGEDSSADIHPDEREGNFDGDPPAQGGG